MTTPALQLAESERFALALPVRLVSRETDPATHDRTAWDGRPPAVQWHLVCEFDGQSVCCLSPDAAGPSFRILGSEVVAGFAAHARRSHPDLISAEH